MMSIEPESLRENYSRFLTNERILLTGHSHQAWPNCAEEGVLEAFSDAVIHVDDKWAKAFEKAEVIRSAVARYSRVEADQVALGQNTHELFYRFLTALNSTHKHLVASDGEFHSVRRQILALAGEGWTVTWVDTHPVSTLSERLVGAIEPNTSGIVCSSVLFETSTIVPHLDECVRAARSLEVDVFIDGYHSFMAHPSGFDEYTCKHAFLSGGGYKYAQWGEGVCWMSVPSHFSGQPSFTGWFSDFANLDQLKTGQLGYGGRAAHRFAGSTYDPTSHYRAARVIRFFDENQLTVEKLRALSQHQTSSLVNILGPDGLVSPIDSNLRGGFLAYRVADPSALVARLRTHQIYADSRGSIIRFGPAPYITDSEIQKAGHLIRGLMSPII
jgi:kynureninase